MNRKQATHGQFKLEVSTDLSEWITFLKAWAIRNGSNTVSGGDLVPVFWKSQLPHVVLAQTPRQTVSIINRLLWNARGRTFDRYYVEWLGHTADNTAQYRLVVDGHLIPPANAETIHGRRF